VIDFNTHPVQIGELTEDDPALAAAIRDVYGFYVTPQPLATFLHQLDAAGIDQAVVLPVDCTSAHGAVVGTNEQIAGLAARSDRLIGFASVDPNAPGAAKLLERSVRDMGLRGLSLDPGLQGFDVAGPAAAEVFAACTELDIPVSVQCGLNWAPQALAVSPLALEPVLSRHPGLRLVIQHFAWPWVAEALMLAVKYPNVTLDTAILFAGTPQASVRQVLAEQVGVHVLDGALFNQVVFGSDYPRVDPKRVMWGIDALDLKPATREKILSGNARRLLGGSQS
jgi:predicted TIM-barrel fold metal-dependent hydrolase